MEQERLRLILDNDFDIEEAPQKPAHIKALIFISLVIMVPFIVDAAAHIVAIEVTDYEHSKASAQQPAAPVFPPINCLNTEQIY